MQSSIEIEIVPGDHLVRFRLSGFFHVEDVERFAAAREEAFADLTCPPNAHVTLADLRGMKIQAQDSVEAFRAVIGAPRYRSRRLAFVTKATLAKTQLLRAAAERDNVRVFTTVREAENWLLGDEG